MNSTCLSYRNDQILSDLDTRLSIIENNKKILDSIVSSLSCLSTGISGCSDNVAKWSPTDCASGVVRTLSMRGVTVNAGVAISSIQIDAIGTVISAQNITNIGTVDNNGNFTYIATCSWGVGAVGAVIFTYINGAMVGSTYINNKVSGSNTNSSTLLLSKTNADGCAYNACKYTLNVVGWDNTTQLIASVDSTFSAALIYGAKDSSNPNAFSINLVAGSLYYLRASNSGSVYSNVVTIDAIKIAGTKVPTIITPTSTVFTQAYDAGTTNFSTPWGCTDGLVDNGSHTPYSQVSKNSDFSTIDGVAGSNTSNGGKVVVYSEGTYYLRASNDNTTWSNVVSFGFKKDNGGTTTTPTTNTTIPIVSFASSYIAVGYPAYIPFSVSNGTDYAAQISKNADFSTNDGYTSAWVPGGGDIVVNAEGSYYIRFKFNSYNGPGGGWSQVYNLSVTTKDVSNLVLATPTLTKSTINDTWMVAGIPQVLQAAPYGTYTGAQFLLGSDASFTTVYADTGASIYFNPPNYYNSAASTTLKGGTPGMTYYYKARMQISGVWTGYSDVKTFVL